MNDFISVRGVRTHNLKNIDVSIEKNEINLVIGPSGSGKSSLVYDTISKIGKKELMVLLSNDVAENDYIVSSYNNIPLTIPIKQINNNNNIRSTIGTYFGLNYNISLIFASLLNKKPSFFSLNKYENFCPKCHGLGYLKKIDVNKIINYKLSIKDNPIKCWNRNKDFYSNILILYCKDENIDVSKPFYLLTNKEKNKILFGESSKKYSIKYKKVNRISQRSTKYYGVMTEVSMLLNSSISKDFYTDFVCDECFGKKYSHNYDQYKVCNISIGEFMTMKFIDLLPFINDITNSQKSTKLSLILNSIKFFVKKAIEFRLGHLCFHRSIPTLSGGEFQRLKMIQLFNTQLSNLLVILDEPLSGLSGTEKNIVFKNICELKNKHTIIIVDHSNLFVNVAKKIYVLGPKGGKYGGYLLDKDEYLNNEDNIIRNSYIENDVSNKEFIDVNIQSNIYQYSGASVKFLKGQMNLVTGYSGVGKTTLLKEYLPQVLDSYTYINQKLLNGNKNSHVVTFLGIFSNICECFARKTKKNAKMFSNLTGDDGACTACNGGGYIEYGYDENTKLKLQCEECEGTGFNKILKKYTINGKNIFDVWNMTIDEGYKFFEDLDNKICSNLMNASSILLGHLLIGQNISTLSGGENIRIKLLKVAQSKSRIFGIDEPFKGLSPSEIYKVALFIKSIQQKGKTVIVVDHSENIEKYFPITIDLIEKDSYILGVKIF